MAGFEARSLSSESLNPLSLISALFTDSQTETKIIVHETLRSPSYNSTPSISYPHIYKKLIEATDDIVKSQFVEMFGDPIDNPKGWDVGKMSDIAPIEPDNLPTNDASWLLNLDAVEPKTGRVLFKKRVSSDELIGSVAGFGTEHVLYSKLRPYLNKVVVPDEKGACTTELVTLKPDVCKLDRLFLASLLRSDQFVSYINGKTSGTKMPRVNMKVFRSFEVLLPPLGLQREFANFVVQADLSKLELQHAQENLNTMMNAILNEELGLQNVQ